MIERLLLASALALLGLTGGAQARAPASHDEAVQPSRSEAGLIRLAQVRDVEVYYDRYDREVLVDIYTGEVVAIREPRDDRWDDEPYFRNEREERVWQRRERRVRERTLPEYRDYRAMPDPVYPQDDYGYDGDYRFEDDAARRPAQPAPPSSAPVPSMREHVVRAPLQEAPADVAREAPAGTTRDTLLDDIGAIIEEATPQQPGEPTGPAVRPDLALGGASEDIARIQILLDRVGVSPGVIDGRMGDNVNKAISAYRDLKGQALRTYDREAIEALLAETGGDAFTEYEITPVDVAGPFVASIPEDYGEKARLERMGYVSVIEMLAERFHMDERFLRALNPGVNFDRPGTRIKVASLGQPARGQVARIVADKGRKQVRAYGADGRLIAVYPATIGSAATPSPTGTHTVERVALDPEYTYNPRINFQQGNNTSVLTIPPGPNGPVGTVWIALSKPTYGIHGTPEPSKIGKTESNGCIRLTNWDARELAGMVQVGATVEFIE